MEMLLSSGKPSLGSESVGDSGADLDVNDNSDRVLASGDTVAVPDSDCSDGGKDGDGGTDGIGEKDSRKSGDCGTLPLGSEKSLRR